MEYLGPLDGEIQFSGTTGRSATNNNPLNLEYRPGSYQDKYDAELEPVSKSGQQRFAKFPTMEMGYQAGIEQIQRRQKEGHTLASFVNQFAPPNENPTQEIIAQYCKALGVNPDTPLSDIPAEKVIIPMLARESGTKIVGKGGGVLKAVGNFLGPSSAEAATTGGGLKYLGPLEDEEPTGGQPKYLGPEPAGEAEIEPSEPPPFAGVTSLADNLALYIDPAADKDDLFTNSYADMLNNYTKGKLQNHSDAIENFVNGNTEKFDPFSQYSEQFTGSKYLPTINGLRSSANTLALGKGSLSLAPTLNTMLSKTIGDDSSYNIISRFERREDLPDIINTLFPIEGVVAGTALKLATSLALADTLNLKESEIDFNVVHEAIKKGGLDKKELATKTYEVLKDMYYVNRVPSMKQELTDRGKLNPLAEKLGRVSADEIEQTMIELSGGKAPDAVQKSLETAIKAGAPEVALAKDKLPDIRLAFKGLKAGFMGLVITAATGFDPVSAMTGMGVWPGEDNPVWDAPLNRKERRQLATETVLEAFFPDGIPKPKGMDELILFSAAEAIPAVLPLVIMSSAVGTIPAFATMGLLEDDPVKGALKGAALGTALKAMHFLGKSIQDQVLTWAYRMAGGASIGGGAAALEGGDAKAIGRGALVFTMFEAAGLPKLKLERLGLSEAEIKAFRDAVESQRVSQEAFDVAAKIPDIGTGERQPPTSVEPVKAEKPMSEEQARKAADEKYPKPKWVEIKKRFDAQTKDMEGKPLPEFKLFWEISHDMEVERRAEIILQDAARPRVEAATEATEALPTEAKAKEVEAFALDQKAAPAGAEAATAPRVYQDADGWWRVEGTEVKTSSQAVAEKAASQVKTLAPTIAPEPKVQQARAGGVGPSGEAAPETIGGVRIKTSELPKSVFQQTLSEYLKNKKAVSQREIEITTKTHAKEVKYAISQGKPVPPEVLADYPDLAKQAGARPAVAEKAAAGEVKVKGARRKKKWGKEAAVEATEALPVTKANEKVKKIFEGEQSRESWQRLLHELSLPDFIKQWNDKYPESQLKPGGEASKIYRNTLKGAIKRGKAVPPEVFDQITPGFQKKWREQNKFNLKNYGLESAEAGRGGEAPAGAKPGGTKMYSGGPDTGPFVSKAAKAVAEDTAKIIKDAPEQIKTAWNGIRETGKNLWQWYKTPFETKERSYKGITKKYLADVQMAGFENNKFLQYIQSAVPDLVKRHGITNWIQAGGDKDLLKSRAENAKWEHKPGYEAALNLTPVELLIAKEIVSKYDIYLQEAQAAGILQDGLENYVNGLWKRGKDNKQELQKMRAEVNSGLLDTNFQYAKKKIFKDYFEGEQAGKVPMNKDIAFLLGHYHQSMYEAIAARKTIAEYSKATADDGMPMVALGGKLTEIWKPEELVAFEKASPEYDMTEIKGPDAYLIKPNAVFTRAVDGRPYRYIDHPALRKWKYLGKDPLGKPIIEHADMYVHPDIYPELKNLLGRSAVRDYVLGRFALSVSQNLKGVLLSGLPTPFHQVHVGSHAIFHKIDPFTAPEINFKDPIQRFGVESGLMVYNHRALADFSEGLISGGITTKTPGIGRVTQAYGEYLFQGLIPRYKMKLFIEAFKRNSEIYKDKYTREQIGELTANQANAAFGELNYKAMGRNPTMQDIFRLMALAPDFLEARLRFAGQAVRPGGREQVAALIRAVLGMYGVAVIGNMLFSDDHKPHWDKPFALVIGDKEYSLRSVPGDIWHLIKDPRSFVYHRLNPVTTRTVAEAMSQRDVFGRKRDMRDQIGDFFKSIVPIPAQGFVNKGEQTLLMSVLRSLGITSWKTKDPAARMLSDYFVDTRRDLSPAMRRELEYLKEFDKMVEDHLANPSREKLIKLIEFKRARPENDWDKLDKRYTTMKQLHGIDNRDFFKNLMHVPPEIRAKAFLLKFKSATPDKRVKLWNQAKELPGIVTERFVDELKKAQEGATQ